MKQRKKSAVSSASPARARMVQERSNDTYKTKAKLAEPTVCATCGAVYRKGRWTWDPRPADAAETTCPACQRIRDRYPAGHLQLSGAFVMQHRAEILGTARNEETTEKAEHPLARIIAIEDHGDGIEITTTDTHLARRIGEALHHAFEGDLKFSYGEDEALLRAEWRR